MAKALDSDKKDKLYNFLTKKDDLFQSWQSSGIDPMPYLTSSFRSENHMLSAGIITNEKE
jgi:predicted acetyltransferase